MSDNELTIEFGSLGIKQKKVSDKELAEWLEQTATEIRQDAADDIERFKVEREE